ncbi:hypothetical protein Fmac_018666 [Flemingia macrophylla]|uniref:Uncharacterized protein n=1 Tax=Flemingia macrophylla TaxID=520843 RepID=A0ABD1M7P8_9FABA
MVATGTDELEAATVSSYDRKSELKAFDDPKRGTDSQKKQRGQWAAADSQQARRRERWAAANSEHQEEATADRESEKPRGQRRKREEEDNPRIKVGLVLTSLIKLSFKGHEPLSDTGVVPPLTPSSGNSSPNSPTGPTQCLNASTAASLNPPSTPSIYITYKYIALINYLYTTQFN